MPTITGGSWIIVPGAPLVIVGSKSMHINPTTTSPSIVTTQAFGDVSAYTGAAAGAPAEGMVGFWLCIDQVTDVTGATLRIGSDASNYVEVAGKVCGESGFTIPGSGWNYILFRLTEGAVTGNPNWTALAYERISFTVDSSLPGFFIDYNTIGDGTLIAANGLGERFMQKTVYSVIY